MDKLVHRHPHVFAGLEVADAAEVERNWEALKAAEKGRGSLLDGIPAALPALALADKVAGRAGKLGVTPEAGTSLGDRLLALVVEARAAGWTPSRSCGTPYDASPTPSAPPRPADRSRPSGVRGPSGGRPGSVRAMWPDGPCATES